MYKKAGRKRELLLTKLTERGGFGNMRKIFGNYQIETPKRRPNGILELLFALATNMMTR